MGITVGTAVAVGSENGVNEGVGEGVTPRVATRVGVALSATSRVNVALGNGNILGAGSAVTASCCSPCKTRQPPVADATNNAITTSNVRPLLICAL